MGQKVNPIGQRIGINRTWNSKWYGKKSKFAKYLHQDFAIETLIRRKLEEAGISTVEIHRTANKVTVNIHSAKPGLIIGKQGESVEELKMELNNKFHEDFSVNIIEIKKPALDATLLSESIAKQIEKRVSYRRAAKMAIDRAIESGAKGAKVFVSGRLNGVEIARSEFFTQGKIPLHTFRADIDYSSTPAKTEQGKIGVKVWIYKGDIYNKKVNSELN